MTSLYLDWQLSQDEMIEYHAHLSDCSGCSDYLGEVKQVSLSLKCLQEPDAPRELHSYIMTTVERSASSWTWSGKRMFDWLLRLNPMPLSYAAGVIASAILFTLMLAGLRPIPTIGPAVEQAMVTPVITGSLPQYQSYNNLQTESSPTEGPPYYELPRVLNDGALASFSHMAYRNPGNEGMSALVEIAADGRAQLVEVLNYSEDPALVEQLWWSLGESTFQPAIVKGRAVSTRIILLVEKVDISG